MDTSSKRKTDAFDDDDDDDINCPLPEGRLTYVHGEFHVSDHSGSDHSELELDFFFEYYLCTARACTY